MTMFSKGSWTVFKIVKAQDAVDQPIDIFKKAFGEVGSSLVPLVAVSKAIQNKTHTVGLAPYSSPRLGDEDEIALVSNKGKETIEDLGSALASQKDLSEWVYDEKKYTVTDPDSGTSIKLTPSFWEPDLDNWLVSDGTYGAWMMCFEYIDAMDANSKKEKMAYDYGAPFKLQTGEIKKQIAEAVQDVNTFTRKHHQLIVDFNQDLVWLNSVSKPVVTEALILFETLGLAVATPDLVEDLDQSQISEAINKLYLGSTIKEEVILRLGSMKLHGPDGIEPHENGTMEKILKAFCAFTEFQGYHIGMSAPMGVLLNENMPSPTGVKTNFEAIELMESNEETLVSEADLMFTEYTEKTMRSGETKQILSKRFSVHASPNIAHKDMPGLVVRGLNIEDFKYTIKQHVKATDAAPTISEFWQMYYDSLKTAVFVYFQTIKEVEG
ncbi:MAG: hypothetical protein WCQ50_19630 [Spirochaetota bacterium]